MNVSLLHCGKRRMPYKKIDIRSPHKKLYADKCWIEGEKFETISIYEFRCPHCFQARGEQSIYGWIGHPYHPNEKETPLFKIPAKHLNQWNVWISERKIQYESKGVWTVQGSEPQWPFRFRSRVSL